MRHLIRHQIIESWTAAIVTDYQRQRINSERSLQASLWAQLNTRLEARTRRMFIEPAITLSTPSGTKTLYPDLVICNSKRVIAVIELKYQPRIKPSFRKDIETLRFIASNRSDIKLANHRYRGTNVDGRTYSLARDVLFVWAGIHRQTLPIPDDVSVPQFNVNFPELKGCFLELHAATREGLNPSIYSRWS